MPIIGLLLFITRFADDRPFFVGEFGVLKQHAPAPDRVRWLEAVRRACETNGMGWAHWEYQSGMGFAEGEPGSRRLDPAALGALGLNVVPAP